MQVVIFITFRYNRDDRRLSHMKFLYQTFTDYNLEEFTRFNMIVPLRISRYRPKILAVCYILMIFSGFLRVFTAPGTSAFTYLLVVFAIPPGQVTSPSTNLLCFKKLSFDDSIYGFFLLQLKLKNSFIFHLPQC